MSSPSTGKVTQLLVDWQQGDAGALEALIPLLYEELRAIAEGYVRRERPGHTLQPTALVHEAFLRLVDVQRVSLEGRAHFFRLAARTMRRILVDHARRLGTEKRGGGRVVTLSPDAEIATDEALDIAQVDEALGRLAAQSERQAQVVELRFFGGLTIEETAEALGVSPVTVKRDWLVARAWLQRELTGT